MLPGNVAHAEAPAPPSAPTGPRWRTAYRRLFAVHEIEGSPPLRWLFWALLLGFYVTFADWIDRAYVTRELAAQGQHLCWPYFRDCGDFYFLSGPTYGHSQQLFYALHFALLIAAALAAFRGAWTLAHALLLPALLWKAVAIALLSRQFHANYHTYHLLLSLLLLLAPYKVYFLRRLFVLLYFLAAAVKFHDGWILGTYFTALQHGLPLVPDSLVPVATCALILMEMAGCWLLLSPRRRVRLTMVALFTGFHLYSILLVGYLYPTMCVPALLILFLPEYQPMAAPRRAAALPGWSLLAALVALQLIAPLTPGDTRLTMEGNAYGLFMFEANHQCRSRIEVGRPPDVRVDDHASDRAMSRCDPYTEWFRIRHLCRREPGVQVAWTFDHSINGGPFYRMVATTDACTLDYRALGHNEWIRTPEDGAPVVGQALRNHARWDAPGTPPAPPLEEVPTLGALQRALRPAVPALRTAAWVSWFLILAAVLALGVARPWVRQR